MGVTLTAHIDRRVHEHLHVPLSAHEVAGTLAYLAVGRHQRGNCDQSLTVHEPCDL